MGVLALPRFRLLWFSGLANDVGDQLSRLALSVTAVLLLHASTFQVGVIAALGSSAYLVLGIPIGVWVDRWPRRPVLIAADLLRAVAILSVPLAYLLGALTIWQLMVVAAVVSVAGVFFDTAHTSILPALVGPKSIAEANARLQTSDMTMRVVGPGVGGQLLRVTAGPLLYFATAAMSLLSVALLTRMKLDEHTPHRGDREAFWSSLKTGIGYIVRHPVLRTFMFVNAAINFGIGIMMAVLPVFVFRDLSMTPAVYGLAISIGAVGGIIGSLIGMRVRARLGELPSMRRSQTLLPIAALALVSATFIPRPAAPYLLGADEFLFGMALVVNTICSTGIRARVTPLAFMGRISAASRFVSIGAAPLGALLGGWLGTIIGQPAALACAAGLMACGPIITKLSPIGRLRTVPEKWEAEHADPLTR